MHQLDKAEAVKRTCQSIENLYAQLHVVQRGQRRWVGAVRHTEGDLQQQLRGLKTRDHRLVGELSLAQRTFSQNEKLELSLEELQELYRHNHMKDQQAAAEIAALKRKYADAARMAAAEGTAARGLEAKADAEVHANSELKKALAAESGKLHSLLQHDVAESSKRQHELDGLKKEVVDERRLEEELSSSTQAFARLASKFQSSEAEVKALRMQLERAQAELAQAREETSLAASRIEPVNRELRATQAALAQATARAQARESDASQIQQQSELACEAKVNKCYEDCNSKI